MSGRTGRSTIGVGAYVQRGRRRRRRGDGLVVAEQVHAIENAPDYPFPHRRPSRRSARAVSFWIRYGSDPARP
jgi:hypothetical protein